MVKVQTYAQLGSCQTCKFPAWLFMNYYVTLVPRFGLKRITAKPLSYKRTLIKAVYN